MVTINNDVPYFMSHVCLAFNKYFLGECEANILFGPWPAVLDYAIMEKPLLDEDMQGGPDYLVLKTLDTDSIRIIGSVLGQSIALDYFVSQVIPFLNSSWSFHNAMLPILLSVL